MDADGFYLACSELLSICIPRPDTLGLTCLHHGKTVTSALSALHWEEICGLDMDFRCDLVCSTGEGVASSRTWTVTRKEERGIEMNRMRKPAGGEKLIQVCRLTQFFLSLKSNISVYIMYSLICVSWSTCHVVPLARHRHNRGRSLYCRATRYVSLHRSLPVTASHL